MKRFRLSIYVTIKRGLVEKISYRENAQINFQRNLAKITRLIKQTFPRSDATKHSLNVVKRSSPVALSIEGDEGLLRLNCQTYLVFELKELSIDTVLMQFSVSQGKKFVCYFYATKSKQHFKDLTNP